MWWQPEVNDLAFGRHTHFPGPNTDVMTQVKDGTKHTTPRSQTRHLHPLRPQLLLSSLTTTIIQHFLLVYPIPINPQHVSVAMNPDFLVLMYRLPPLPIYRMHVDRDELNGVYEDVVESNVKRFLSESRFEDGDCLVFLPNMDKVVSLSSSCARIIGKDLPEAFKNVEFLRLSSESTPKQQDLVNTDRFTHDGVVKRKIIFATSVAERQFEFPRVRMVIISGRDELSYYDPLTRSTELRLVFCSKAQITRQSSRSGAMRVEVVQCMTQSRHDRLDPLPPRPLLRSDLASMLISVYAFGLDPESFRWYTTPRKEQVDCATERLVDAGLLSCSANGDKLVLNEKGKLAPGLELTPEMISIFCHACPRDGIVPEYAYDLMVLIALTSVSAPFVRLTPRANIGVSQLAPSRFINPDSEHLTLIHMWIAWHSLYQAGDDIDFCDEHALVQSTCIEIGDKVNALISRYESQFLRLSLFKSKS